MQPENIKSLLVIGQDLDYELFKIAIFYAESGTNVWFISPEAFEKAPGNMKPPDKEVLQLITFMYLKDYKDLISQLNGIHLWSKLPGLIIVRGLDNYCSFNSENYDPLQAALVATSLLDGIAVCASRKNEITCLLVTCNILKNNISKLQSISELYFPNFMYKTDINFVDNVVLGFQENSHVSK